MVRIAAGGPGRGVLAEACLVLHCATRRALIPQRFPYGLFYRIYGDTIVIVACMHAKRDPQRWQRRL